MSKTGLIFFPAFDWAISPTHPEREERLLYTRDQIFEEGILDYPGIIEYTPRLAAEKDIQRVHFCIPNVATQTVTAHFIAAGSALKLGDALMKGEIDNAFSLVRPPGHHALRVVHGNRGFCNINNEAILVEYLRKKYQIHKIAIIDTDVHHGDGTQDIFYHDPDILFISIHQDGRTLYPGTGFADELGGPGAYLKNINITLPPGTTDEGFLKVWREIAAPFLKRFSPEIIINSAGQDNHFSDPLANMLVSCQGYAQLTDELKPDIAVLEGGYAIETALPYVNLGILLALAGRDYSYVREPKDPARKLKQDPRVTNYINKIITFWQEKMIEKIPDKEELFAGKLLKTNSRRLYYDTDNIHEQQQEFIHYCAHCPGIYQVISQREQSFNHNYTFKGTSIPLYACPLCREKGYEMWQRDQRNKIYDLYCLQDKKNDTYLQETK